MKLLELLVKERIGSGWYTSGWTKMEQNSVGSITVYKGTVAVSHGNTDGLPIADDWQTAIVTKEQYDNACKLVDDGYTLWFGGECPVNHDTLVDLAFDDNADIDSAQPAFHYDWKNQSSPNIIAYKVAITKPDGSDEELSVVYEPSDLLSLHVPDVVNHPSHYTNGKVECIDAIESATVGKTGIEAVCVANVIKYLWRYEDKNGLEDIKKAQWYLNKLIEVKK